MGPEGLDGTRGGKMGSEGARWDQRGLDWVLVEIRGSDRIKGIR